MYLMLYDLDISLCFVSWDLTVSGQKIYHNWKYSSSVNWSSWLKEIVWC